MASPACTRTGFAGWKATYDERGNATSVSYFGTDGKPCLHKDGYAGWKATFDERGTRRACPTSAPTASPA